jgi:hypothetical protein
VYVLRDGEPVAVPVEVGIDDGLQVEIRSESPAVGEAVIVDVAEGAAGAPPARSPLRF